MSNPSRHNVIKIIDYNSFVNLGNIITYMFLAGRDFYRTPMGLNPSRLLTPHTTVLPVGGAFCWRKNLLAGPRLARNK